MPPPQPVEQRVIPIQPTEEEDGKNKHLMNNIYNLSVKGLCISGLLTASCSIQVFDLICLFYQTSLPVAIYYAILITVLS